MSRFLVDSHVFMWLVDGSRPISRGARDALEDATSDLYLSVAGIAELCIKSGRGRLKLPDAIEREPERGFGVILDAVQMRPLPVTLAHAAALRDLPLHHRDPFDRLMIVQALVEGLAVVTHDRAFARYDGLTVLWA